MDARRLILWMVFSVSLVMLWDNWQREQGHPTLFGLGGTSAKVADKGASAKANDVPTVAQTTPGMEGVPAQSNSGNTAAQPSGEKVRIKTDVLDITFDTQGAQIVQARLLKHPAVDDKTQVFRLFETGAGRTYVAQTGVVGIPGAPNHKAAFAWLKGPTELTAGQKELKVSFEATGGDIKLVETYTFKPGSYEVQVSHALTNLGAAPLNPSVYLQLTRDSSEPAGQSKFYSTFTGPAVFSTEGKYQKVSFSDIEKSKASHVASSKDGWLAIVQHYFVSAFLPPEGVERQVYTRKVSDNLYSVGNVLPVGTLAPGASIEFKSRLYAGPQEQHILEQLAPGLDLVRDYGWLAVLCKPIFWLLEKINDAIGNWGWAIIVLTILVKLAFFPLSAASYKSMARMRQLAPRLQKLRDQYGDDKMKLNTAMMEMYKTEKINPLGGCLPILVQMPVFLSLYWVLSAAVEMRNAPWLGWITDLATPDPFYILPVIMAVSMFIQTKLNPTPPDPIQAKVMMIMPLVFSVMFVFFPAGLVLYWVVNNILSIAQQWTITRAFDAGTAK